MSGTKVHSNYEDLLTFTRASKGHALRPVSYGDELVTNGTFDTDSDWTLQRVSIAGGVADFSDNSLGPARVIQDDVYTVGKIYLVTFDVNESGTLRVYDGAGYDGDISVSSGTVSKIIYAEGTQFIIRANVTNDYTGTIDNVSVKEVLFDQPDGTLTLFEHPVNVPRVEWDSAGNRLGLLVEEARTNILNYSEDFNFWSKLSAVIDSTTVTNPDGTTDGFLFRPTSTAPRVFKAVTGTTANHAHSVYAKAGGKDLVQVGQYNGSTYEMVLVNLNNGDIVASTGTASVTEMPNGWYRISVTGDSTSTNRFINISCGDVGDSYSATAISTTADGTSGIYIYGAQVEAGSFPTSYIKTTGSTATRSADVASIPVADFGFNADEGTLFAELRAEDTSSTTGHTFYSLKKDTSNYVRLDRYSAGFALRVRDGGTYSVQAQILGGEPNTTDLHKVSAAYKANDFAYVYNGGTVGTDTSGTVPDGITTLHLSEGDFNGHIKKLMYIPRRLTNAQLVDLTS